LVKDNGLELLVRSHEVSEVHCCMCSVVQLHLAGWASCWLHLTAAVFCKTSCSILQHHVPALRSIVFYLQVKEEGYEVAHNGLLVTVFSAPNYCDQMGNKGAFVKFNGSDMVPHFTTFEAVPHPDVKPMAYASSFLSWGM
jgi:hypothetical protein